MMQSLPPDATIKLNFLDDTKVEYILDFFKTLALKRLVAKSTYTVDVSFLELLHMLYIEVVNYYCMCQQQFSHLIYLFCLFLFNNDFFL